MFCFENWPGPFHFSSICVTKFTMHMVFQMVLRCDFFECSIDWISVHGLKNSDQIPAQKTASYCVTHPDNFSRSTVFYRCQDVIIAVLTKFNTDCKHQRNVRRERFSFYEVAEFYCHAGLCTFCTFAILSTIYFADIVNFNTYSVDPN